jgi:hypothetical protein
MKEVNLFMVDLLFLNKLFQITFLKAFILPYLKPPLLKEFVLLYVLSEL